MKDLFDKLSTYNIFNYLLPGVVFVAISDSITRYSLVQEDLLIAIFLYYFVGLVISRIGSIIIEPILKKVKFLHFSLYREYVCASEKDKLIVTLSEANNMYRTFCALFLCLLLLKLYETIAVLFPCINEWTPIITVSGLLLLFVFSYKKQTTYISERVNNSKDRS